MCEFRLKSKIRHRFCIIFVHFTVDSVRFAQRSTLAGWFLKSLLESRLLSFIKAENSVHVLENVSDVVLDSF